MKISIITPSYNSQLTLERTINSVIKQQGIELEYIIVDGGSKDNTLAIINKYSDKLAKIISEPDKGIYDAMNKGIKLATGEVIGIINSDDFLADDFVLSEVAKCLSVSDAGACYGDISYFTEGKDQEVNRVWQAGKYRESKLNNGWAMPHPALFVRKSVYDAIGLYRTDLRLAGDYEFMLRLLKVNKIKVVYLPKILTRMQSGGASARNFKFRLLGWKELRSCWTINNLKVPLFFIPRRLLSKISQFI